MFDIVECIEARRAPAPQESPLQTRASTTIPRGSATLTPLGAPT